MLGILSATFTIAGLALMLSALAAMGVAITAYRAPVIAVRYYARDGRPRVADCDSWLSRVSDRAWRMACLLWRPGIACAIAAVATLTTAGLTGS